MGNPIMGVICGKLPKISWCSNHPVGGLWQPRVYTALVDVLRKLGMDEL